MDVKIKNLLNVVVVIVLAIWLLRALGLLGNGEKISCQF